MKVRELVADLIKFDQDLDLEILVGPIPARKVTVGSIYDDTDPLYNKAISPKATVVTIECDPE